MRQSVFDFLDELHIQYEKLEHPPILTMEEGKEVKRQLNATSCKNLFLCNKQKEYFLLLYPENKKLDSKSISRQIGSSHLSFARQEDMQCLLHTTPGAASVLGLIFDMENRVRLLIDHEIAETEYIACHPCVNTCSLKIRMTDLLTVFLPAVKNDYTIIK